MKLKRVLAGVLSAAMVLTSAPVSGLTAAAEGEKTYTYTPVTEGVTAAADSEQPGTGQGDGPASYALEDSADRKWHSNYNGTNTPATGMVAKNHIFLTLAEAGTVTKLKYTSSGTSNNGRVSKANVYVCSEEATANNKAQWTLVAANQTLDVDHQTEFEFAIADQTNVKSVIFEVLHTKDDTAAGNRFISGKKMQLFNGDTEITGITATTDAVAHSGAEVGNMVDADDGNQFHTVWGNESNFAADKPVVGLIENNNFYLTLPEVKNIGKLTYRSHTAGNNGTIKNARLYVSTAELSGEQTVKDITDWTLAWDGSNANWANRSDSDDAANLREATFEPMQAKYVRLEVLNTYGENGADTYIHAKLIQVSEATEVAPPAPAVTSVRYGDYGTAIGEGGSVTLSDEDKAFYNSMSGFTANVVFKTPEADAVGSRYALFTISDGQEHYITLYHMPKTTEEKDEGRVAIASHVGDTSDDPYYSRADLYTAAGSWHKATVTFSGNHIGIVIDGAHVWYDGNNATAYNQMATWMSTHPWNVEEVRVGNLASHETDVENMKNTADIRYVEVLGTSEANNEALIAENAKVSDELKADCQTLTAETLTESDYTEASWAAYSAAKTAMETLNLDSAKEWEIYDKYVALVDAKAALEENTVDPLQEQKDALQAVIDRAQTKVDAGNADNQYTEDLWNALTTKLQAAKDAKAAADATADSLTTAKTELEEALTALAEADQAKINALKEQLTTEIAAAQNKLDNRDGYTGDFDTLQAKVTAATTAKDNADATAEELTTALTELQAANAAVTEAEVSEINVAIPNFSFTQPVKDAYQKAAALSAAADSAHYETIADHSATPAAFEKKDAGSEATIAHQDGVWGFIDAIKTNDAKFDQYGSSPFAITLKLYVKSAISGNKAILGRTDEQYGLQISGSKLAFYGHVEDGWTEQSYSMPSDFYGKWHDIILVYNGSNRIKMYVDGTASNLSADRPENATIKHYDKPFTIGYNVDKASEGYQLFTKDQGLVADVKLYTGADTVTTAEDGVGVQTANILASKTPAANITVTPYDAKTTWSSADGDLAADAAFGEGTVYTATTVLTAHEGYKFDTTNLETVKNAVVTNVAEGEEAQVTAEAAADGSTVTVTVTYPATEGISCLCTLSDITLDDPAALEITAENASPTVTLQPSATASRNECTIHNTEPTITYAYAVTEGANVVSVTDAGAVTALKAGSAKIKVTASIPRKGDAVLTKEKEITVTVTDNRLAAQLQELQAVIDRAQTKVDAGNADNQYTEELWNALTTKLQAAKDAKTAADATADSLTTAKTELEAALAALNQADIDALKAQLTAEIAAAQNKLDNRDGYEGDFDALQEKVTAATAAKDSADATAEALTAALTELQAANAAVTKVGVSEINVKIPSFTYAGPEIGAYQKAAALSAAEDSAHYTEIADHAANPVTFTKKAADSVAAIEYHDGVWGFNDQIKTAVDDKFDKFGETPFAFSFKLYVKSAVTGTKNIFGKMDHQYGFQIDGTRLLAYYCHRGNGGEEWPEQDYTIGSDFYGKWHDIVVVYDGDGHLKFYVDGQSSTGNADHAGAATIQHYDEAFTIGYNPVKDANTMFTSANGLLADLKLYSGANAVDSADYDGALVASILEGAEADANVTLTPYDAKTTWTLEDGTAVDRKAAFAEQTAYKVTTVLTAHDNYVFDATDFSGDGYPTVAANPANGSASINKSLSADRKTVTITVTYSATPETECLCTLGEITLDDASVELEANEEPKTITLSPQATVNTNECTIHATNAVTYAYEVTEGEDVASVTEAGVVTASKPGTATIKVTATMPKKGDAVETKEKTITLTVTSKKATDEEKAAIETAITTATEGLNEEDYTAASWEALQDAITAARQVAENEHASKEEVAAAIAAVNEAKTALKPKTEVKDTIDAAVAAATEGLKEEDYTAASWEALQAAITAAQELATNEDASEEEVAAAIAAINEAKEALKSKAEDEAEKEAAALQAAQEAFLALHNVLTDPNKTDSNKYTAVTWNKVVDADTAALAKYNEGSAAKAADMQALVDALQAAVDALETKDAEAARLELEKAKAAQEAALKAAKVIIDAGQKDYSKATWDAFVKAYNELKDAPADANSVKLNSLVAALTGAQKALATEQTKLAAPTIKALKAGAGKKVIFVKVTVNKVEGADHYEVYRVSGGKATLVGKTKSGKTVVKDKKNTKKSVQYYAVAVSKDGKIRSDKGALKKITLNKTTKIKSVKPAAKGVRITWKKIKNVKSYVIYRSNKKKSGYRRITTQKKKTYYVDKKAKKGTFYYKVAVRGKKNASLMSKPKKIKR